MQYEDIMGDVAELGIAYIKYHNLIIQRKKKFRRWWSRPLIRYNYLTGFNNFQTVFKYFKLNDEEEFINFTRMDVQSYEYLYSLVQSHLIKRSKRPPLPQELRLSVTLNYLAHGDSLINNKWFNSIGLSTIKTVIPEVCNVLCEVLLPLFVKFPTARQFETISTEFMIDLHFPNCIGAIDGRHCKIKKPKNSGSLFFNYKKFDSVMLMACCDSKKRFIWANVGDYGSLNDAEVFNNSDLGRALAAGDIDLPPTQFLPNSNIVTPHFLIGDGGFGLRRYLMKPYVRNNNLPLSHRIYNYRLSHARMVIECAFGQLSQKWLVNEQALAWRLESTEKIIMTTICLHNYLIDVELEEVHRRWDVDNNHVPAYDNVILDNHELTEIRIRQELTQYFMSNEGATPWQWNRVMRN